VGVGMGPGPSCVRDLKIWVEGMALVNDSYTLTRSWPKDELFGLTAQVRRAAVSIPCNLAEGRGRGTARETARFAQIALGSAYELDTLLQIATGLGLANENVVDGMRERLNSLARQISSFIRSQRSGF